MSYYSSATYDRAPRSSSKSRWGWRWYTCSRSWKPNAALNCPPGRRKLSPQLESGASRGLSHPESWWCWWWWWCWWVTSARIFTSVKYHTQPRTVVMSSQESDDADERILLVADLCFSSLWKQKKKTLHIQSKQKHFRLLSVTLLSNLSSMTAAPLVKSQTAALLFLNLHQKMGGKNKFS